MASYFQSTEEKRPTSLAVVSSSFLINIKGKTVALVSAINLPEK